MPGLLLAVLRYALTVSRRHASDHASPILNLSARFRCRRSDQDGRILRLVHDHRCKSYKDLVVWQKSLQLAVDIHRLTESFPRHERFGIVAQLRRAAVSISSNIAEGAARRTTRDFIAFLHIARGSLAELETQLLLAERTAYVAPAALAKVLSLTDEVGRMINGMLRGLQRRLDAGATNH